MITFKELKDICNKADGNIFCKIDEKDILDEVGSYYLDKEYKLVVLDFSNGWNDNWVHLSAKEVVDSLYNKYDRVDYYYNDTDYAEDDWQVIADYCNFYSIDKVYIKDGNVICKVGELK